MRLTGRITYRQSTWTGKIILRVEEIVDDVMRTYQWRDATPDDLGKLRFEAQLVNRLDKAGL